MLVVNTHLADPVEAASPTPSHVRWRDLAAFVAALPDGWAVVENERYLLPEEGTTKDLLIIRHA
jgi:hypothetical protein